MRFGRALLDWKGRIDNKKKRADIRPFLFVVTIINVMAAMESKVRLLFLVGAQS